MSHELIGAIEQLTHVLRRHFTLTGSPPKSVLWSYKVDPKIFGTRLGEFLDARFEQVQKVEFNRFFALIESELHPLIAEALSSIEPLAETGSALRNAKKWIERERADPAAARCCHLLDELCAEQWFKPQSAVLNVSSQKSYRWGYRFQAIKEQLLADLIDAGRVTVGRDITTALSLDSEEQEIVDLLNDVGRRMSTSEILREFNRRNMIKAESTTKLKLSSARRKGAITSRRDLSPPGYGLPQWK